MRSYLRAVMGLALSLDSTDTVVADWNWTVVSTAIGVGDVKVGSGLGLCILWIELVYLESQ